MPTALLVALLGGAGCGRALPPSVSLTGTVTVQQTPVESGQLVFQRLDKPGSSPVGTEVRQGTFSAPIVPTGKYRLILRPLPPVSRSSDDIPDQVNETPAHKLPQAEVDVVDGTKTLNVDLAIPAKH